MARRCGKSAPIEGLMGESECGMRNAECGMKSRGTCTCARSLRTPHSALRTRRGLAPLELVLALPLLLAVMALMIVFGNAAYWKVRGLSVARNAAWSNRWPRHGFDEPTPTPWAPGQFSRRGSPEVEALDDPQLQHPVVRGPLPNDFVVDDELLNPARGALEGHTQGEFQPAMMPSLGAFRYDLAHNLIDDKFQYLQMDIP